MNREIENTRNNDGENTPSFLLPSIGATASQDSSKGFAQPAGGF